MGKREKEETKKMEENSERKRYKELRRAVFTFEFKNSKRENLLILTLFLQLGKPLVDKLWLTFQGLFFCRP
jgi:hypothetical protein